MRLLIIEDEKELANALGRGLKSLGYAVDTANDGLIGEQMAVAVMILSYLTLHCLKRMGWKYVNFSGRAAACLQ